MGFGNHALTVVVGLLAAACTGSVADVCAADPGDAPPRAPTVVAPGMGAVDVVAERMVISTSEYSDRDATDQHTASMFEIWQAADGEPVARVWSAHASAPEQLTAVALADGEFIATMTSLAEYADYGVRVRHMSSGLCQRWSEWSPFSWFRTDDGSSYMFDQGLVHSVYIDIPPASWGPIDAEAVPPDCVPFRRSYHSGTLRFEDKTFLGVGVRAKGGCGSARHLDDKAAFKVNLQWDDPEVPGCPDNERRLYGLKRLTLNNMVQDPSFAHERLVYPFYKLMGVPTPRAVHMQLYVNDELWGLYTHVESIDRRFLGRWFDSNQGMLYEGTYRCDLIADNVPPTLDDSYCLARKFEADECSTPGADADATDYELLRDLVAALAALPPGGFYPEVEAFFEFDRFLSSWAVDSVIAHWDAYEFDIINNYRVYHDPVTARWTLIPTGVDQTLDGDIEPWAVSGLLARRCLDEPDCEAAFAQRLAAANAVFEGMGLLDVAAAVFAQVSPYVEADPRREIGYSGYVDAHNAMLGWISARPARVREILAGHGF